ncbi:MAG: polysaccharide biosynthesis tyrosine autokinase, partial [Acidobacteria bacterium]|nr:polysaccharide biosynthesis tyrosine autokinase [Acidobacteriota bacterium]
YGESEVHLLDRLSVLYRYRNIVIAVVTVVLVGGALQTYTTTKEYRASAIVRIDPDRPVVQGIAQNMFSPDDEFFAQATELTKLQGHALARRVARKLNLANNPEFNGQEVQSTGLGDALQSLPSRLTAPIKALFKGSEPKPSATAATAATAAAEATTATADPKKVDLASGLPEETPEEAARVNALMGHVTVRPQQGTRLVTIEVVSRYPQFAADAANAFADEYVTQNLDSRTAEIKLKKKQYEEQRDRVQIQLEAQQRMYIDAQKNTPSGVYVSPAVLAGTLSESRNDVTRAANESAKAKSEFERLSKVNLSDMDAVMLAARTVPGLSNDPSVLNLLTDISTRQKERSRLKSEQGWGDNHPRIVAIDSDITSTKEQVKQRLVGIIDGARLALASAQDSERRFREAFDDQNKTANIQATQGISLEMLQGQITGRQELLTALQKNVEEADVEASSTRNNVSKMESAQVPGSPFKPDPAKNMLMALLAGFVLALGLAFGLDYLDDTVKTPEDITRKLHVPFLGLVPAVRGEKQPVLSGPVPHDFGESYRALRTSLVFTSGGESTRVITVTSAQPLEGKTTTACNLAMVLAFGGSRVLLMDADMRRPGVHKALKINNTVGLSHLLVGQARVREAIQRTSDPNFCVMTAGRTPPNPSELLSSERMRQLIANLKQGPFDWVVIDTPPVLAVTDAVILTPLVDGVTFVVGAEMTRRRLAERAVHMIMASRPKVVGAVLNRVNFDRNKYYYSRYYGYQYKSYYGTHTSSTSTATPKA